MVGYKIVYAVESDPSASLTHAANFPEVPLFKGDIRHFLLDQQDGVSTSQDFEEVDLVFGGPPCQGFSQIGPRDENDPRNLLYKEFVRVLENLRPRTFVMENVPNILSMRNGHCRHQIVNAFRQATSEQPL